MTDQIPTTSDIRRAWFNKRIVEDPYAAMDADNNPFDDEFDAWLDAVSPLGITSPPKREWFFGDIVTLDDHPSGGFSFVDSDSTDVNLCTHEQIRYLLNPASEAYKQYGPYRLVAIHGIDLKVRGE